MKIKVLDHKIISNLDIDKFSKLGELEVFETTNKEEGKERLKDADIVILNKVDLDEELILSAPNLKLICVTATGMDNVDLEACKKANILVKNVAGYSTDSVCEHTFALLFALNKQIIPLDKYVKSGDYTKKGRSIAMPSYDLMGKEWGIVGLGNIGKKVAKVAETFGANVSYTSVSGNPRKEDYKSKSFDELLKTSDIISIHSPLNNKTRNLFSADKLALMKDGAILINVGRGNIIDEDALAKAVDERDIKIGLDVFGHEPLESGSLLLKVKNKNNVVLTPHTAWGTLESRTRLMDMVYQNVVDFLE